jgi:hypothetical protein
MKARNGEIWVLERRYGKRRWWEVVTYFIRKELAEACLPPHKTPELEYRIVKYVRSQGGCMTATEEIKEMFPQITFERAGSGFSISGTIQDVDEADKVMEKFIPTGYRRGMYSVFYETNYAHRTYRRNT